MPRIYLNVVLAIFWKCELRCMTLTAIGIHRFRAGTQGLVRLICQTMANHHPAYLPVPVRTNNKIYPR